MKHLKKHWSAQPISLLLSLLMMLPVWSLLLQAAPASAQAIGARQPVWAVLDFANPSGYGSSDVGRLASDSFVIQLAKLNRYTVLPREQLLTGIQNESLTPPLNLASIERLGQSLGVDAIVAGEISSISFSRDRRQAKVSIAVRVIDPRSGFLLNGALATGLSNPRPIPVDDEEQLVNEAFGNAAFNATRQLSKFNLPVATVLISGNETLNGHDVTVTINRGTRDGLYPGLDMMVSRGGRFIGTLRVAQPTDNDANCEVTDLGLGIEPGDRCTAIFHMPSYSVDKTTGSFNAATADLSADAPTIPNHNSAFRGITGLLLAVISGGILLSLIHSGHNGDNSLGGANVSGVQAVSGLSSSIGGPANIPLGFPSAGAFLPVTVRISANIGNIDQSQFLEFHVYRSDSPPALSNAANLFNIGLAGTAGTGATTGTTGTGTATNGVNTGGLLGINGFGQVPLFSQASKNLQIFDDFQQKTGVTASKPDPSDTSVLVTFSLSTLGLLSTTVTTSQEPFVNGIPGTGLNFGQRVSYSVEGLYIQPATYSTGSNTGTTGINPGTGVTGTINTNGTTNTNGSTATTGTTTGSTTGTTNTGGNTSQNTSGNTTGLQGHQETFQLTSFRNSNTITYIEPVAITQSDVTSTGSANVNITVPATAGANDYILQISSDPGFSANVRTYKAPPGAYTIATTALQTSGQGAGTLINPNQFGQPVSATSGTAVVFNNINLTTDFPGSSSLFFRVGARNSADNGQSNFSNDYIFDNPLSLPLGLNGASMKSSIQQGIEIHRHGRF